MMIERQFDQRLCLRKGAHFRFKMRVYQLRQFFMHSFYRIHQRINSAFLLKREIMKNFG